MRILGPERKIKARLVVTSECGPKKVLNKTLYNIKGRIYNKDIKSMHRIDIHNSKPIGIQKEIKNNRGRDFNSLPLIYTRASRQQVKL